MLANVQLTHRGVPKWPEMCACCLAPPETLVRVTQARYEGHILKTADHFVPACNACAAHQKVASRGSGTYADAVFFMLLVLVSGMVGMGVGEETSIAFGFIAFVATAGAICWFYGLRFKRNEAEATTMLKQECSGTDFVFFRRIAERVGSKTDLFMFTSGPYARAFSALNNGNLRVSA
jgi:hypothetical protein